LRSTAPIHTFQQTLMSASPAAAVPYQAYKVRLHVSPRHFVNTRKKSKRHSRSFSNSKLVVSPSPSPPPPPRPSSVHDPLLVQPTPTPQPRQHVPENAQITGSDGPPFTTTRSASVPIPAVTSALQEGVSSSPSQPHSVPASPIIAPPAPPVVVSVAQSIASTSTSSTPTSMRTRKISTFRHVPSRATSTPVAPSPLSIGNSPRAVSFPSRNLDPNKASRPQSRLSTVTLFGNSSPAEASHDVPINKAVASTQPQGDTENHTLTKTVGATSSVSPPVSVQRTPSETPSHTPAASSPATSPSPSSVRITSTLVRSSAPYRPGFQPKGVYRPLTDDFLEVRRSHRDSGRVEQTRLERRLEKLINLHFGEVTDKRALAQPKQVKRMSSIWELDIRKPGDLWRGVIQSQVVSGSKADLRGVSLCYCSNKPLIVIIVC
jgi:rabenosyn-5